MHILNVQTHTAKKIPDLGCLHLIKNKKLSGERSTVHEHWYTCNITTNLLFPLLFKLKQHCNVYAGHELSKNTVQDILYQKNGILWINIELSGLGAISMNGVMSAEGALWLRLTYPKGITASCTIQNFTGGRVISYSVFWLWNEWTILKVIFHKWLQGAIPPCLWPNEHQISECCYQAFNDWRSQVQIQHS